MTPYQDVVQCGGKRESPPILYPPPPHLVFLQAICKLWILMLYRSHTPSLNRHLSEPNSISRTFFNLSHRAGGMGKFFLCPLSRGFHGRTCTFGYAELAKIFFLICCILQVVFVMRHYYYFGSCSEHSTIYSMFITEIVRNQSS